MRNIIGKPIGKIEVYPLVSVLQFANMNMAQSKSLSYPIAWFPQSPRPSSPDLGGNDLRTVRRVHRALQQGSAKAATALLDVDVFFSANHGKIRGKPIGKWENHIGKWKNNRKIMRKKWEHVGLLQTRSLINV